MDKTKEVKKILKQEVGTFDAESHTYLDDETRAGLTDQIISLVRTDTLKMVRRYLEDRQHRTFARSMVKWVDAKLQSDEDEIEKGKIAKANAIGMGLIPPDQPSRLLTDFRSTTIDHLERCGADCDIEYHADKICLKHSARIEALIEWLRINPNQKYKVMKRAKMGGYENMLDKDWQELKEEVDRR